MAGAPDTIPPATPISTLPATIPTLLETWLEHLAPSPPHTQPTHPQPPNPQMASKAQKASVTTEEVHRYLEYDARHGAKYIEAHQNGDMDEDDW